MEVRMNRFAMGFALVLAGILAGGASSVSVSAETPDSPAQTADASAAEEHHPWYGELAGGGTFGHTTSGSVGLEGGRTLTEHWRVFVEVGRMSNVATANLDQQAQLIASVIGSSYSTTQRAVYFDAGARYEPVSFGIWHPYGLLGLGFASVKTSTAFGPSANEATVSLGNGLSSTLTKLLVTAGVGVTVPFASRYLIDLSYRYGRIFPRTGQIEGDTGINTQRLQAGIGVTF
jgi:opacity protein-like surface antigen